MKIGMILDSDFPPDPRVESEALTLIKAGHAVHLFCLNFSNQENHENIKGIQVSRYPFSKMLYNKLSPLAFTFPFYHCLLSRHLKKFLRDYPVEALHIHDMIAAKVVFALNTKRKLPVVLDLHENRPAIMRDYSHVNSGIGKYLINLNTWEKYQNEFIQKASKLILVTEEAKREVVDKNLKDRNDIFVLPNTVNLSAFLSYPVNEAIVNKYAGKFVVLYLGDTGLRRGTATLLHAVKHLIPQVPDLKVVMVGKSRDDRKLQAIADEQGIRDYVELAGWQDLSLFPGYIAASDVCVSPLKKNAHHDTTFANKIFQYMALGKPLVVSDALAQANLVEKINCGRVHRASDPQDLARQIIYFYKHPEESKVLGEKGRQAVINDYNWEKTGRALLELYDRLPAKGGS